MKIKDYRVVWGGGIAHLDREVNRLIKDGWQPMGSVCVDGNYYQAMVKYEEKVNDSQRN